ncbi:MAG: hypothetical protein EOP04_15590 [Proteobacteria bacterium]|nr:MAG: hypothetical protein EOP04_15590 [Pseudomonadota bacterium]
MKRLLLSLPLILTVSCGARENVSEQKSVIEDATSVAIATDNDSYRAQLASQPYESADRQYGVYRLSDFNYKSIVSDGKETIAVALYDKTKKFIHKVAKNFLTLHYESNAEKIGFQKTVSGALAVCEMEQEIKLFHTGSNVSVGTAIRLNSKLDVKTAKCDASTFADNSDFAFRITELCTGTYSERCDLLVKSETVENIDFVSSLSIEIKE